MRYCSFYIALLFYQNEWKHRDISTKSVRLMSSLWSWKEGTIGDIGVRSRQTRRPLADSSLKAYRPLNNWEREMTFHNTSRVNVTVIMTATKPVFSLFMWLHLFSHYWILCLSVIFAALIPSPVCSPSIWLTDILNHFSYCYSLSFM